LVRAAMKLDWKKLIKLNQAELVGLDIGTSSVRMVQLQKDETGYAVVAANITEIPDNKDDISHREAEIVRAIRKCVHAAKVQTRRAVCSVSGPEVAVRAFSFPPLKDEEVESAVMLEAAQVCPFNIDDAVVDYQLMPNGEDVKGILVAATNDVVKRKKHLVEKASLECVLLDVDSLALLNCFGEHTKKRSADSAVAILDVAESSSIVAIVSEDTPPFVRNMHYAGADILSRMSAELAEPPETVAGALAGCDNPTIDAKRLRGSLERACQKLITGVTDTLRYHTAQEKSSPVEKMYVCGSFSMAEGLVDVLGRELGLKTLLWNPFDTMQCNVDRKCLDVVQNKGPAMAVAAGLAMRTI